MHLRDSLLTRTANIDETLQNQIKSVRLRAMCASKYSGSWNRLVRHTQGLFKTPKPIFRDEIPLSHKKS